MVFPKSEAKLLFTAGSPPIFDKAAAAVVAPVPPLAIAIVVPLQVPEVIVPTPDKLEPVIVDAKVVPVNVPALTVERFAFTYAVVAMVVELSLVTGVGAVGTPVRAGEAIGAFNKILFVLEVILAVFAFTFVVKVAILFVLLVILAVLAAIEFVFAVILIVWAFTLVVKVCSAALAVVASELIALALDVMLAV